MSGKRRSEVYIPVHQCQAKCTGRVHLTLICSFNTSDSTSSCSSLSTASAQSHLAFLIRLLVLLITELATSLGVDRAMTALLALQDGNVVLREVRKLRPSLQPWACTGLLLLQMRRNKCTHGTRLTIPALTGLVPPQCRLHGRTGPCYYNA